MAQRAVFLDRDGVINELALNPKTGEWESPHSLAGLSMLPGAVDALRRLQEADFLLFIVSNQPSYAKGKVGLDVLKAIAAEVDRALRAGGVRITEAYYCHHHPQGIVPGFSGPCGCRKPGTQSLTDARDRYRVDLAQSWFVGDQETDIECGRRAGCRTVMIANPLSAPKRSGREKPTLTAENLPDAVARLLAASGTGFQPVATGRDARATSPLADARGPDLCSMKCLVLAAGMSTRIAALTGGAPKPLTPVAGVPVLHRNLLWLARNGIREMYINLHYRADEIKASVADGAACGVKVTWSEEDPILGTAGAAKKLERELTAEGGPFLLVYGDNVFDFDLRRMVADHKARHARDPSVLGTIAVFDMAKNLHTGIAGGRVANDPAGRITGFVEGQPDAPGYVNAACYVLESAVLQYVPPPPQATDWMRETFPRMLAAGQHMRAYLIEGYCLGIDTPESYRRAQEVLRASQGRRPASNDDPRHANTNSVMHW